MDNPEILFYIAAALIYFFTRGRKKKRRKIPPSQTSQAPQDKTATDAPSTKPTLSFEELLKEITGQTAKQTPAEPPVVAEEPTLTPTPTPTPKPAPKSSFDDERSAETYRRAAKKAKQETRSKVVKKPKGVSGRDDAYKITDDRNVLAEELREMLKDPDDVRKAVVVSEILKRKY